MKISLPNIKLIQNNNENLIKVIQGSFALNFYGLINRKPKDLDLLIFSKNNKSIQFLNKTLKNNLEKVVNLTTKINTNFFKKFQSKDPDLEIEVILAKFLNSKCYKKIGKNFYFVKFEYAVLAKIVQISVVLSNRFLSSNNLNLQKIMETLQDTKTILKNKLVFNKVKHFIKKNLINIIINNFTFDFFTRNRVELIWFSENFYKYDLINAIEGGNFLSKKIKSLYSCSLSKKSRNLFNNLMVMNDYILKNKNKIIEKINFLNGVKNKIATNEIYLQDVNFFFNNFQIINKKNIIFKSKISASWNLEIIEINKYFTFLKILRILDLKYKINQQLNDKEILIYSNENKEFIFSTLYKLIVLLTFI
ncbi:hypothetical protein V2P41_01280 [Mesomycoplasma hyopneumoniae]|uniref:hypothetical protein n=1 Tax=Mesomycoplasma hyopneumoniae TaxID=2099 RepID=UPI001F0A65CD|nr:hypothetical protein [Mesomycoplasma hyopneumoniae]